MTQPIAPVRAFNFTNFSVTNPNDQQPGVQLDADFNEIIVVVNQIRANLALIQKDDTTIANNTIGRAQLKAEVVQGVNTPAAWVTSTAYTVRDSVIQGTGWYWCQTSHTSGVFATDLAAAKWVLIYDFSTVFSTLLLSSTTPAAIVAGLGSAGAGTTASRADHVHPYTAPNIPASALLSGNANLL